MAVTGNTTTRTYKLSYMNGGLVAQQTPYVCRMSNVIVETNYCAILDDKDGRVYIQETSDRNLGSHPYVRGPAAAGGKIFSLAVPDPEIHLEEPFILLGTDGTNYSHWLTRNVLKFALLDTVDIAESVRIMVNADLRGFQLEYLDMLGVPKSRLLLAPPKVTIRCREVYVPTTFRRHPKMRDAMHWLRDALAAFMVPPREARDLIFISRRDSTHRVLLNEAELEAALGALGFQTLVLSELTVAEQIRAFSSASVIVGAHGAGMTNLVFAPRHAAVIEITNTNLRNMDDFPMIAACLGQSYIEIVSDRYPAVQPDDVASEHHHHYSVDVDAVIDPVREILRTRRNAIG